MNHALLLTDVVDSTKLSEQLGDAAMATVWVAHDRVARDLLPVHHGREIDKTDGFLLLFDRASDAVDYALAYHRALEPLRLRARAGLHVGPVILRENAAADVARGAKPLEVEGLAKPTAARVMGLALPGQTLLTAEAAEALPSASNGPVLLAHGHWMLKGLFAPVPLFEVGVPGVAPMTPPPDAPKAWRVVWKNEAWLPVRAVKHSLPAERDAFVGREADLQALAHRLDDGARLVTVLGPGGTGKTRLVTRYGWTWLGSWPGGAWFCDLSEARSVEGIVRAVAVALDVPLGKDDPVVQLGHAIAGRGRCLVVLDNFEQVSRHAPETVGRWLDRAREASFVVTSREVLGLPGEQALALAPLGPDEAAALFVARAQAAKRDFVLSEAERPGVERLVALLDGLPLAIELAAARVRVMAPKVVLERMTERFKLLSSTGGRHTRQATLRATLDWSWDLLSVDEQSALAQLSVFEGGFTLEAAEAVLSLAEAWPVDAVQALVDKSLVRRVSDERFDLLVSVQEYAAEKLEQQGQRSEAEARHAAWFAQFGSDEALDALSTHGGVARLAGLAFELDNLVAACRRSVGQRAAAPAVALLRAAWQVLGMTGPTSLGLDLAERVTTTPGLQPEARATAATLRGQALQRAGRMDAARGDFDAALAVYRESWPGRGRDRRSEGRVLGRLGLLHAIQGRNDEARAHYDAALAALREVGDRGSEGQLLGNLGTLHKEQGRMDEAREHYETTLTVTREVGDRRAEGITLGSLGILHSEQGRIDEACEHFDAAVAVAREVGDRRSAAIWLGYLGSLHAQRGRMEEAREQLETALVAAREVGERRAEGAWLANLGLWYQRQGGMDEARALLDSALAVHREVGDRRAEGNVLGNLAILYRQQGRIDEARACYETALAVAREIGDRRAEGVWLGNLGNFHRVTGSRSTAREMLVEALAIHRHVGYIYGQPYWLSGLALVDAADGERSSALDRAHEAVAVASPYPGVQAEALSALARVLQAAGDLPGARAAVARARRLKHAGEHALLLSAVDALLCEAQGDSDGCLAAIAEVDADPHGAKDPEVASLLQPLRERVGGS